MPFLYESLLWWGLPLVGLPILIHLINMLRHRRVNWAAMEFLVVSQKRHRRWIIFKQLLLLLLRMAAVAAIALMVAQPLLRNQWGALFGGSKTHHVVLLDDSYSMSDRWNNTSAFEEAKQVILRLAGQATHQDIAQEFTLLRFSQVGRLTRGTEADMLAQPVERGFSEQLEKIMAGLKPSETAAGPNEALEAIDRLPARTEDENRVIYVVSDFRAKDWDNPVQARATLAHMQQPGTQIHLVNCVDEARPNLAITALLPGPGTRAAGVPLLMEVSVHNYGARVVNEVSVNLEEDGVKRPAIVVERVPPGKTITRRFPVLFQTAGEHQIAAALPSDAVAADNSRYCVVDLPAEVPVLILDGDPRARDAYFLATALAPGGKINSGLKPVVESPRFLRGHSLDKFESIFLLNIERLDPADIDLLEDYARHGGGVGFFMGELSRAEFFNSRLYRNGQGLFPLPLAGSVDLLVDRLEKAPDLEITDHPIFSVFAGERNSFINSVMIQHYFAAAKDWAPPPDSTVKVIARLRNGAPLAVESRFGDGRVVAILTKAGPLTTPQGIWNNWGRENPSYVVAMLEMEAYLAAGRHVDTARLVGTPLDVRFPQSQYKSEVQFVMPQRKSGMLSYEASPVAADPKALPTGSAPAGGSAPATLVAKLPDTDSSGVYEAHLVALDGTETVRRYAFNVDPGEGDLAVLDGPQLAARLPGVKYEYHRAQDLTYDPQQVAGFNLGESLVYLLIALLIGEQLLAYAASYHPPKRQRGAV